MVCDGCGLVLRADPDKVPAEPVNYRCRRCGRVAPLQACLRNRPPQAPARSPARDEGPGAATGTVYHHVSAWGAPGARGRYELVCTVTPLDAGSRTYRFASSRITLGRAATDLVLPDPLVSRVHAEIERVGDQAVLKDRDSTNGTFVNGERVRAKVLAPGDRIRLGNTRLSVEVRLEG